MKFTNLKMLFIGIHLRSNSSCKFFKSGTNSFEYRAAQPCLLLCEALAVEDIDSFVDLRASKAFDRGAAVLREARIVLII